MTSKPLQIKSSWLWSALLLGFCCSGSLAASELSQQTRQMEAQAQTSAVQIQRQVERLDQRRQEEFQEWRQIRRETLLVEAHNRRLAEWNQSLRDQILSIERQMSSLDATREELDPLLEAMAERLRGFVEHDLPFNRAARLQRVQDLQAIIHRVDVSHAEKLRQLLATYRSEVEQGRYLHTRRETMRLDPQSPEERLTLLRVGRVGLYYLSEDQQRAGYWSAPEQRWISLSARERAEVIQGIELAEERSLPQLLNLPLSVPLRDAEAAL